MAASGVERVHALLGGEHEFSDVARELKFWFHSLRAPVVGALHLTCADECEAEATEAFRRSFAHEMLPRIKHGSRAPMRLANLGGRYEWGAVRIAEAHFATPQSRDSFKVLLVKVDAHVAVERSGQGLRFGMLQRYGVDSPCCGALAALFAGQVAPFVEDLEAPFLGERGDRLEVLRDASRVPLEVAPLFMAALSARLQARRVTLDIQDQSPSSPTFYVVLHGVTLNKPGLDSELLGGLYTLDRRGDRPSDRYRGLGDDPAAYRLVEQHGRLRIEDEQLQHDRAARDHRGLVREKLRLLPLPATSDDSRLAHVVDQAEQGLHQDHPVTRAALKALVGVLASLHPVTTALYLFGAGVLAIHHAHQAHRLARAGAGAGAGAAREMLEDVAARLDTLPPERLREITRSLLERHARGSG